MARRPWRQPRLRYWPYFSPFFFLVPLPEKMHLILCPHRRQRFLPPVSPQSQSDPFPYNGGYHRCLITTGRSCSLFLVTNFIQAKGLLLCEWPELVYIQSYYFCMHNSYLLRDDLTRVLVMVSCPAHSVPPPYAVCPLWGSTRRYENTGFTGRLPPAKPPCLLSDLAHFVKNYLSGVCHMICGQIDLTFEAKRVVQDSNLKHFFREVLT